MREENGLIVYEVSEFLASLNEALKAFVDPQRVAVEGEVSSFKVWQERFVYFDVKDATGIMNCFLVLAHLRVPVEDGMRVRVWGVPKVVAKSGKFSFTVQRLELVGEGALRRSYELMKKRLADEGLFAPERKRPVPRFPETIGLIASRESAAAGDFLRILGNRWGGVVVLLADVQVQGGPAVGQIVGAFRHFNAMKDPPPVLVLTRGGGSLEDLAAFNDERVARAIFSSKIPVVVGVGHERDETIADFVADLRASTPTNAAELVVPDRREIGYAVGAGVSRMIGALEAAVRDRGTRLAHAVTRLEGRVRRSLHAVESAIGRFRGAFREYGATVVGRGKEVRHAALRLLLIVERWRKGLRDGLAGQGRLLQTLDPKAVLRRGYAIVTDAERRVVRDAAQVDAHARLAIQLHRGTLAVESLGDAGKQKTLPL